MGESDKPDEKVTNEKPVSLHELSFEQALGALLGVKPKREAEEEDGDLEDEG